MSEVVKPWVWNENGSITTLATFVPTASFCDIFRQDLDKLHTWWPRFEPCKFREIEAKRLPNCNKLTVRFACTLLNETCSTVSCAKCTKRIAPAVHLD